ncbi:2Fe-2S iron-sulfur cluster-binding protein [Cyanobium sp. WAJ14-Wanaka]|uniref:2Fe-2S iron-sulfur cluster-binding protein n=1 Tax=Cyanobium sp. WAJ14-Wanaka TaxID=2823725 RepID=UPI0020CDA867|nr:2Fe-2S iron-sulfur cluster-binding protein [Cyanobium sp. WAJ14-Wanaka]MCP9775092.1 2Fe-2S iron-sulfur cluster binding domain-containing protein [Cyanobium sp. WAJ14-Wanaka]
MSEVLIHWPDGSSCLVAGGTDWLEAASRAGYDIPTGCLGGSCGACEIDVNGETVRACIATVPSEAISEIRVELVSDPFW